MAASSRSTPLALGVLVGVGGDVGTAREGVAASSLTVAYGVVVMRGVE